MGISQHLDVGERVEGEQLLVSTAFSDFDPDALCQDLFTGHDPVDKHSN